MSFLVDTSVWSLALRRKETSNAYSKFLQELIESGQNIFLMGIILQEILQGIVQPTQFDSLQKLLAAYPLLEPSRQDYEDAARLWNVCRRKGIQAGSIDFLIAATAINHKCYLVTADKDFANLAKHSSLKLKNLG